MNVTKHPDPTTENCQRIGQVLARVGEKWSALVIALLAAGPLRFTDIKRAAHGISQRMLTVCLRGLERDGLVKRTVHAVMPPHVEYELTPLGRSLQQSVSVLDNWARDHLAEIDAAREAFDAQDSHGGPAPWQQ
ncbi:winged helix-turn-helix transcriptional regulator [Pseudomonas aeruginosa]|uniref:winged helix-turn-helix transcriptional regulator n=1 Tax=Pseudomonas aeruginosa TaxID=287 RepID=UPI00093C84E2|nr:helix-turn-helix domain-containing protein [Pseudomonas aeruginosa]HBO1345080.1 helix-turn-helix transcriptional regulator [Pseudomonas aeruginosa]